jgi:uncharacterized HhH-GPD family protein
VRLTFDDIARIIGAQLPASRQYPAFWSNSSTYARAWKQAGHKVTRADCLPGQVRFLRVGGDPKPTKPDPPVIPPTRAQAPETMHALGSERQVDVVIIGCVKSKVTHPAAARDLYSSPLFLARRHYAETSGASWFIASAEFGLIAPDEWLSPYDRYLPDLNADYRAVWAQWCAARLTLLVGDLTGRTIEIHAGAAYVDSLRPALSTRGATVLAPVAALRMGEQLAWYAASPQATVSHRAEAPPQVAPRAVPAAAPSDRRRRVADALLAFRSDHIDGNADRRGLSGDPAVDDYLRSDPFAFLVAVILDEGIKAERAWRGPWLLRQRLGHLDPDRVRRDWEGVRAAVAQPPALHRFVDVMARAIQSAGERVCTVYNGDASRIWAPGSTAREVDDRLQGFQRIGQKKAAMAVEILIAQMDIALEGLSGTDIAYDVQVRRVFLRTALADRDDLRTMINVARELEPERPGLLDLPAWFVGREWCHPHDPDCDSCPLTDVCPRRGLTPRRD